ncbi:hypothetical protein [Streptomyces lycii]|uniref:Uncharacterized protein n=1 Tax=Streptomyces lycii TaxID=2654337 RepID=A0ABQ7FIW2_9ACTN|nr:hypothetical protein [Streptomyces lycii]KAF4408558.1 hypothetical protein GCU69_13515 [Streptomyces lycii]
MPTGPTVLGGPTVAPETADIVLAAEVTARELRFHEPPDVAVRFTGRPGQASVSDSARRNLPDRVTEAGDHRDVHVDYLLAARLVAEEPEKRPGRAEPEHRESPGA